MSISRFQASSELSPRVEDLRLPRYEWQAILKELGANHLDANSGNFGRHFSNDKRDKSLPSLIDFEYKQLKPVYGEANNSSRFFHIYTDGSPEHGWEHHRSNIDGTRTMGYSKAILIDRNGYLCGIMEGWHALIIDDDADRAERVSMHIEEVHGFHKIHEEFYPKYRENALEFLREVRQFYKNHPDFKTETLGR